MKLGGNCPLNIIDKTEKRNYLIDELSKIYFRASIEGKPLEEAERMYCSDLCRNLLC